MTITNIPTQDSTQYNNVQISKNSKLTHNINYAHFIHKYMPLYMYFDFNYINTGSSKKLSSMFKGEMYVLRFLNILHKLVLEATPFIKCYTIVYLNEKMQIYFISHSLFSS